jgi:hypothetical protein
MTFRYPSDYIDDRDRCLTTAERQNITEFHTMTVYYPIEVCWNLKTSHLFFTMHVKVLVRVPEDGEVFFDF